MEAGALTQERIVMGSAAVIFVLLVVLAVLAIECRMTVSKLRHERTAHDRSYALIAAEANAYRDRNAALEAEILRLRKIPLTQPPEKADTSVIRAKSPAQVRQITEAAWGKMPELEEVNVIDNGE